MPNPNQSRNNSMGRPPMPPPPHHSSRNPKGPMPSNPRRRIGPARAPKELKPIPLMPLLPDIEKEEEPVAIPKKGTTISNKVELAPKEFDQATEYTESSKGFNRINKSARVASNTFILLIIAVVLEFLRIKPSFLPSFLEVDFSIVPEFIGLVFFGPVVGLAMVAFKNIAHMLVFYLMHGMTSYVAELSNFLTDSCFIITVFFVFRIVLGITHSHRLPRNIRIRSVFLSGLIGSVATSLIMLPVTRYFIYPLFVKFFASHGLQLNIFSFYVEKLPSVKSMLQAMLIFNLPWEFCKLLGVTIFATIIYALATLKETSPKDKSKK